MTIYRHCGQISEGIREALLNYCDGDDAWDYFDDADRRYACWTVSPTLMFVKIPPGGFIDRHTDAPAKRNRLNIELQTNAGALNWGVVDGIARPEHLEDLQVYQFDASREHWATNAGDTDRIILVETVYDS